MGIFDFLFGKKQAHSTKSQHETVKHATARHEEYSKDRSEDVIFQEAFNNATTTVTAPQEALQGLFCDFKEAFFSGSPRDCDKVTVKYLAGSGWTWGEFDRWHAEFTKRREWPYMWSAFDEDEEYIGLSPKNVTDALYYFKMNEMKYLLKKNGINIKPAPKTKQDTIDAIKNNLSWQQIKDDALLKYQQCIEESSLTPEKIDREKCLILSHTISMTFYALRNYHQKIEFIDDQMRQFKKKHTLCVDTIGGCSIESEFAEKFNKGKMQEIPPFFPGDRNSLGLNLKV